MKPEVHDATRGAGSYAKTMAAMLRLRELKCSAERTLAFTPTPNNVDEIQQLYGFATLMGANTLRMNAPQRPAHVERMEHCGEFDYLSSEFYKQCFDKWDRMVGDLLKDTLPFVSEMDMVRMPQLNPGITDREITGIIAELEKLRLIKISHPWLGGANGQTSGDSTMIARPDAMAAVSKGVVLTCESNVAYAGVVRGALSYEGLMVCLNQRSGFSVWCPIDYIKS